MSDPSTHLPPPNSGALSRRHIAAILLLLVALSLGALLLWGYCPPTGCAVFADARALNRLKNRSALPRPEDFDREATLGALLGAGDDRARWSQLRAASVEGYVVSVTPGPLECANCFAPRRRDVHIELALRPDAPPRERLIVEVTPRLRDWARLHGQDWSAEALSRGLVGRRCRVEGWLMFDGGHAAEAEHTNPGGAGNWRATAWEIHPVTSLAATE